MNGWIVLLVIVAVLGGIAFWLVRSGWWAKAVEFLNEVRSELKKVSYPTREEIIATTIVVIVTSAVFAVYLWLTDLLIIRGYESLFRVLGS
jgi:preprotein translocase subunit SecE